MLVTCTQVRHKPLETSLEPENEGGKNNVPSGEKERDRGRGGRGLRRGKERQERSEIERERERDGGGERG